MSTNVYECLGASYIIFDDHLHHRAERSECYLFMCDCAKNDFHQLCALCCDDERIIIICIYGRLLISVFHGSLCDEDGRHGLGETAMAAWKIGCQCQWMLDYYCRALSRHNYVRPCQAFPQLYLLGPVRCQSHSSTNVPHAGDSQQRLT